MNIKKWYDELFKNEMGWYILIFSSIERTLIKTSGYRRKKVIELSADQFLW